MESIRFLNAAIETIGANAKEVPNWFVVVMGVGTVFVGLICIIILCKIVALFCKEKKTAEIKEEKAVVVADAPIENRQEIIAAVAAVCAEELGTDVSALRIHSFRKI
jgi:Na+-transporting methylmalonyl-CoA/oxaloacetate decarboxylase gamma subunit